MNNLPALSNTPPSSPATNNQPNQLNPTGAAQGGMPHMHSPDGIDAQTRGEKRPRTDEIEVDAETSTEPQLKLRRTASALDVASAKETKSPEKSLSDACKEGDLEVVKAWCERGADLMATDETGYSPLSWACAKGHLNIVTYLQESKQQEFVAVINKPDMTSTTLLHLACGSGHLAIVQLLVKAGARLHTKSYGGYTTLHIASVIGCAEVINYLLSLPGMRNTAVLNAQNNMGATPFLTACEGGHLAVVKSLVDAGAATYAYTAAADNALHLASRCGAADIVAYLLGLPNPELRYLPFAPNKLGISPFLQACAEGHLPLVQLFIKA